MSDHENKFEQTADKIARDMVEKGILIESGAHIFIKGSTSPATSRRQAILLKIAFMAGAEHLFATIMRIMDPDAEPTDADLNIMTSIGRELDKWRPAIAGAVESRSKKTTH